MEQLYTVENIANMLSLTTRTIRNYLKDGILKGRKIGGQWRFTEEDFNNFINNPAFATDLFNQRTQNVLDFLDGVNTDLAGEFQTCSIIDIYLEKDVSDKIRTELRKFSDSHIVPSEEKLFDYCRYTWEYMESELKSRLIIFASPQNLVKVLEILQDN